jgi:hypothetical protein
LALSRGLFYSPACLGSPATASSVPACVGGHEEAGKRGGIMWISLSASLLSSRGGWNPWRLGSRTLRRLRTAVVDAQSCLCFENTAEYGFGR